MAVLKDSPFTKFLSTHIIAAAYLPALMECDWYVEMLKAEAENMADSENTAPTVWVVEQGQYSGYRVVGVFSSEGNARLIADALNAPEEGKYVPGHDVASVAEWPLDPAVAELNAGHYRFNVTMLRDGTVEGIGREPIEWPVSAEVAMWKRAYPAKDAGGKATEVETLNGTVWAKDEAHAVKIVNELRAQMIASGEWK
jgi:hypothetical protein